MGIHVSFEIQTVEDRAKFIATGMASTRDIEVIIYHISGDKNTVLPKEITAYEKACWKHPKKPHLHHIPVLYEAWKNGLAAPLNGKSLREWPLISPSQINHAAALNIHTVEDFAELNDEGLRAFGIGGQQLKQKAKEYLAEAAGPGRAVEKIVAMEVANKEKDARLAKQEAELAQLRVMVEAMNISPIAPAKQATEELVPEQRRGPGRPPKQAQLEATA